MTRKSLKIVADKLNGSPHIRRAKNLRNRCVDAYFRSRGVSEGKKLAADLRNAGDQSLCFTIAFNTPWVIDILTKSWLSHVVGTTLVVMDNSNDMDARKVIERICGARGVRYMGLPTNPEWSPNRSHGIAMNWIFHNVIGHVRPELFGFIDHDCFPVAPIDIMARIGDMPLYGLRYQEGHRWYLWAGFCFYRFQAVDGLDLDFKHSIEHRLDTGGANWSVLYNAVPGDRVVDAGYRMVGLSLGNIETEQQLLDNAWLHIGGASYRNAVSARGYRKLLCEYIWMTYLGGTSDRIAEI